MYSSSSSKVKMTFYRDSNQKEIALIVEENGILHPIEIKLAGSPDHKVIKAFDVLKTTTSTKGRGAVICCYAAN